ncbi:MAG: protein kinase [Myxococcota bacterium]
MSATAIPEEIGPYRVLRRLGRGGMAEVYVARDATTGEEHALKIMAAGSPHAARFNHEYEALTRLNHPSIVRVYQYGLHERAPWFSMELVAGEPLQVWMKRLGKPGTPARTAEVMRAGAFVADAVSYVHARNLIHRDLKGNNVLMLPDGRVKLLDFGTAHIRDGLRQLTKPGEFIGTLAYASPEQFRGQAVDERVDVYALGVLLYRMVTGHRPFSADDPASLARLIARAHPKPPIELVPQIPPGLDELILELLSKNPDDRPRSARVVARRLEALTGAPLTLPGWGATARTDRMSGREDEVKRLRGLIQPSGRALLLMGQQGSDRERVCDQLIEDANRGELNTIVARLTKHQPLLELIDMLLRGAEEAGFIEDRRVDAAVAALRLLRQRGLQVALRNHEGLTSAMVSVLVGLGRARKPLLVAIQNAHLADPPALELLAKVHQVVLRGKLDVRFLISVEVDTTDAVPRIMQHLPKALRVALNPLGVEEVALKIGAMLDRRPPPHALARTVHEASGGQPLWVEAIVHRLLEDGSIRLIGQDGNRIEWDLRDDLDVPEQAEELLITDLRRLPELERRVIICICIAGAPTPMQVVADALGWTKSQLLPLLRSLADRGLIRVSDSQVILHQPLIHRLAPSLIGQGRQMLLERSLAQAIVDAPPRPEHVRLLLRAGRNNDAVRRAYQGARALLDELRTAEALEMLEPMSELAKDPPPDVAPSLLSQALLLYANTLLMVRPVDPNLARALSTATRLSEHASTDVGVELARARLARTLGHLVNHRKQLGRAEEKANASDDSRLKSMVACELAEADRLAGRIRDADRHVITALEHADSAGGGAMLWARTAEAGVRLSQGQFAETVRILDPVVAELRQKGPIRALWRALPIYASALRLQGRYTQALTALYDQVSAARRSEEPTPLVRLLLAAAECEADLHRLGRAQEHIDEIDTLVRKGEQLDLRISASVIHGRILLASGHLPPAARSLQESHQRARTAHLPGIGELARALIAETLHAQGKVSQARDLFASATIGLLGAHDAVALVEGTLARLRAVGPTAPAQKLLKPVAAMQDREQLMVVRIESLIANGRYFEKNRRKAEARESALDAQAALDTIGEHLSATDRAALRIHPWSRHVRAILK